MNKILNYISDKFVFWNLEQISHGYLNLVDVHGKEYSFGDNKSFLKAKLKINNPSFCFNILRRGSSGLGESYMNGEFETEDLTSLIELSAKNIKITYKFSGFFQFSLLHIFLKRNIFSNTKERSKKNISLHYDLGNEFFSTWLDKTLTYSCGIFNSSKETLEKAQINKYNKLIDLIQPKTGDKILEIGCGWGGFAEHLAKNYDVKLDCITISKKQFLFTKARINNARLNHKVNVKMLDYRDVSKKYDSIFSIEMIEAVGEKYLNHYFKTIKENLVPGGRGAIQAIVIKDELHDRYKTKEDFIQKYIFPGGFLPSIQSLNKYSNKSGLKIEKYHSYGSHYSSTLNKWRESFLNSWDDISRQGFNSSFKKMWNFYFAYCDAGFKSKNIDLVQFSLCNK
ncbi:cyclopropane-fatty-acyl-phospholipid synthase family protein [Pelagibacteraceae bacterium]|nr:cyclopropane-fatty-acyl-phospholipid synthase family protein [Pelagibacteraceae bacterium]